MDFEALIKAYFNDPERNDVQTDGLIYSIAIKKDYDPLGIYEPGEGRWEGSWSVTFHRHNSKRECRSSVTIEELLGWMWMQHK